MKLFSRTIIFIILFMSLFLFSGTFVKSIYLSLFLSLSIALLIFPIVWSKEKITATSPLLITFIYLLLAYPLKFIAQRLNMPYVKDEFNMLWNDELMTSLFFGLTLGISCFLIAYKFTPSFILNFFKRLQLNTDVRFDKVLPRKIFLIYLIGLSSLLIQLVLGFYSSFMGEGINYDVRFNVIFYNFSEYMWYGLIAGFLWIYTKQREKSLFGNILFIIMLTFSILMGIFFFASKTYMVYPFLFFILAISIKGVKIRMPVKISILIAAVFVAFLFVPQYRANFELTYMQGRNTAEDYVATGEESLKDVISKPPDFYFITSSIINRFSGIDITAVVFANVPNRYDYFYFDQLFAFFYSFIPRVLYPDKPTQTKAHYFNQEIAGMYWGGAAAPSPLGEGYVNLGYVGIALLFGLWGFLQSILYKGIYLPRKDNFIIQVIYVVVLLGIIGFGAWILSYIAGIFQLLVFLIPFIFILRNKKKSA